MSQCGQMVLAGFCCSVVWLLAGGKGSAENDAGAMARAALPPPVSSDQSSVDRHQPPQAQTQSAHHEWTRWGPRIAVPRKHYNHTPRQPHGEISAFSKKSVAPPEYHARHRVDGANLTARGSKPLERQTIPGFMRDQAYGGPPSAGPPEAPVGLPHARFGYNPAPPPGYGYPSVYQPPWLPGPTPPR
jgi:hypothetical protein